MKNAVVFGLFTFALGCSSHRLTSYSQGSFCSQNALTRQLCSRGAEPSSIEKLVFIGSEADFGADVHAVITDRDVINAVWDSLSKATDYGRVFACGVRKIEFYSSQDSELPLVTLRVLCGDMGYGNAHIEGIEPGEWNQDRRGRPGLYVCEGLHELVMKHLKQEYERRQKGF